MRLIFILDSFAVCLESYILPIWHIDVVRREESIPLLSNNFE